MSSVTRDYESWKENGCDTIFFSGIASELISLLLFLLFLSMYLQLLKRRLYSKYFLSNIEMLKEISQRFFRAQSTALFLFNARKCYRKAINTTFEKQKPSFCHWTLIIIFIFYESCWSREALNFFLWGFALLLVRVPTAPISSIFLLSFVFASLSLIFLL